MRPGRSHLTELARAREFALKLRQGEAEETVVGYRVAGKRQFVDWRRSGQTSFHESFAEMHSAPLTPAANHVRLHIFLDWSSVEVFANGGERVITDLIFPAESSVGLQLYTQGGDIQIHSLEIWRLSSIWN